MDWEDILKEDDKAERLYADNLANDMSKFLKDLNAFTKDANDKYKGAYGNTPSKAVIKQLSSLLDEMRRLLKEG